MHARQDLGTQPKRILGLRPALALFALILVTPLSGAAGLDPSWEEVSRTEELVVYRKNIPNSSIFAYRGEAVVKAPFERVLSVVMNAERRKEWMERVSESKTVKTLSPTERIDVMVTHVPWPLLNRDFIFKSTLQWDKPAKKALLRLDSIELPEFPPVKDLQRGWIHHAEFELTATSDLTTKVIAESHVDPRGWVPTWIINVVQKSFPKKTLTRLTQQALKPDVKPY